MLQLWKARRGRKAAVALIAPFIERSRATLGGIPESVWSDPYLIGFLSMLASLEAREEAGSMRSYALGLVQCEALAELSGHEAGALGEKICLLSMEQETRFHAGCRAAVEFHGAMGRCGDIVLSEGDVPSAGWDDYPSVVGTELYDLWKHHFESRIPFLS